MTEEELCSHCGIGHVRPMHFNMEEAIVICDNHECDHLLTTIPSEKIIKRTLFAPTLPFQMGVRERYGSSNSSSSGFISEIRSPLLSPAPSTTTSLTDKEVELLFNPSYVQKEQPEKKKSYLENNPPEEKLQSCKMLLEKCKSESCNDSNASNIEIINSKHTGESNCHSVKNHSSNAIKNHGNHEFLKALDKLELQDIENNANIGGRKSALKMISNSCRKKSDYSSLVIPSYSSAFSQVSPHRDINYSKSNCNMNNVSIKQEVSNEATDLFPNSSSNSFSFFSPVSSDDSGYTEEITNKQEIKRLLENKEINLNKGLTKICIGKLSPSSHYENVVKDLIKPSFPLAAVNISVHPAVISYDGNSISAVDRNTNNEDSSTSDDANILMPSASRIILQHDSRSGPQLDNKDSNIEKSKDLDESLINQFDIILENDINHAEVGDLKISTCKNYMMDNNISENLNIKSDRNNPQEVNSENILTTINSSENQIDSHDIEFTSNIKSPIQDSVLINPVSPFNYSDGTSTACSPYSIDQPSENDNFSDKASVESNASDNSISSYGSFGHHHRYVTDQDSSIIRKGEGKVENNLPKKKNKGKGRGRGRMNMIKENNLQNFDGLSGPSAAIPSKRSKIINVPEPVRVSQRSKQNIEFQATKFASHVNEEENSINLQSTSLSAGNVRRGLASLVHGPDYGSVNSLINSTAHRLSSMSYRSTPSGSFESDPWSVLEIHVEQIDVEVVVGPKDEDQQGNDSKPQHAKTPINNKITGSSTWSGLSNIENKKVENNFRDIPNLISKCNSGVKQLSDFEIGSSNVNIKEKPKSQDNELDDAKVPSAFKDNPTIIFSTLKELHQMNATKMFENKFTAADKRDLIEGKENKNSVTNPLFKSESVNVFTKGSKIWNSSYNNSISASSNNAHSNNSFIPKSSPAENKLSTSSSQYPLLVSPDSRFVRSWVGNLEGYKHEENEIKTKSEFIEKNSLDITEKLDPIKYFNALLRDVSFEDRFFQCPTSESLQTTFEEHLNSSLFFGETAESRSPSENIESRDIESETDLSPRVLKMLDEVMNEALESDSQKNSKQSPEFDRQYQACQKPNLSMNSNVIQNFCKKNGRDLNSVREESNKLFSQSCIMFGPSEYTHCKKCESPINLNSQKTRKECQHPNIIDDFHTHDSSLSSKQCSVVQGRSESSPIKDSILSISNSNNVEINLVENENKSEQKSKTDINEIKKTQSDAPKPCIKIKLIKSQVDPTGKNSRHTWSSDPSYISNIEPRDYNSETKLGENEASKSLEIESIMSFKELLPAASKNVGTTSNTKLLKNINEKEPDISLRYKNTDLDLPQFSKKCVPYSPGTQKLEDEIDSDNNPGHLLNSTASSDSLHLNLSEDELDDNCPVIAINSDDEVEIINDGSKSGNVNKINDIVESKDQSHLFPFSTEIYPLKCNSPETQDLYTLLSSGLEKSETKDKEKVNDEAKDNNTSINISSSDFNRTSESNFEYSPQQHPKLCEHDEVCCGILDNSVSHNNLCRSPRLKEFVDFSFCVRDDSNRQVYLPKSFRKKSENVTSENKTKFDIPKPPSPNEISLLKLQEVEQSHSLNITPNKVLFGCTKSGPQYDDFCHFQKSDDTGPGILEMSFPDQMTMWQNTMYVDEKGQDKINSNYLEVTRLKNNPSTESTEVELSAYESEIDTIQPASGLESESCVYDASDEDNMESDCQSTYDSRIIQTIKKECLSRDEKPLMVQIKNEYNEVLKRIPILLGNKNEILPEALTRNVLSAPSSSCQRDIPFNLPNENVDSKIMQSINYYDKKIDSCKSLPLSPGDHEFSKKNTNLKENKGINNSLMGSKMSKNTEYLVQEHELKNKTPKNCIISLPDKKENTNTIHNNSKGVFEFLSDAYSQNKNMYKVIKSQLKSKSEKLLSTDIESDESCDSIDCKQPRGRKLFTLIPPVLKRSYDSQVSNSVIISKPSRLHNYGTSPHKTSLNKLWEKWASKNASEECNSHSEETEHILDKSYKPSSPNHLLGSHSRKRKMVLNDKDNSFMSDKKYHKIIYSYKKGGFVCRPTSQMLRKISELRKREEENKVKLEKQNQEEEASHRISKERENILRMTRDNLIERRKRMKAFRMQRIANKDTKKHLEELTLQYKARRDRDREIQRRTWETVNQVKERSSERNEVPENIIVMVDGKMHLYHRDPYKK